MLNGEHRADRLPEKSDLVISTDKQDPCGDNSKFADRPACPMSKRWSRYVGDAF
jgi:hypothetical protein